MAILNSLNAHNFPIVQPILMIFVSNFLVHRALSDNTYLSLGLLSPSNTRASWRLLECMDWIQIFKWILSGNSA